MPLLSFVKKFNLEILTDEETRNLTTKWINAWIPKIVPMEINVNIVIIKLNNYIILIGILVIFRFKKKFCTHYPNDI